MKKLYYFENTVSLNKNFDNKFQLFLEKNPFSNKQEYIYNLYSYYKDLNNLYEPYIFDIKKFFLRNKIEKKFLICSIHINDFTMQSYISINDYTKILVNNIKSYYESNSKENFKDYLIKDIVPSQLFTYRVEIEDYIIYEKITRQNISYYYHLDEKQKLNWRLDLINMGQLQKIIREKLLILNEIKLKNSNTIKDHSESISSDKNHNNISLPKDHLSRKIYLLHKLSIVNELKKLDYSPYQINDLLSNILDTSYKTIENHINTINSLNSKDLTLKDEWYYEYLLKLKNLKSTDLQDKNKREKLGFLLKNM
ncbi:hypothetical protein ACTS94_11015 [Empedobacter falsenii]